MNEPDPIVTRTSAPLSLSAVTSNPETLGDPTMATPSTPVCIGEYVLLGELGRGGMGVVYRAEDPRLKREVALKVMLPQFAANPQAKMRFVREARAQAKVEHDHVAAIFQVSDHDGLPYLVMPLLKGMTLHAALKANPRPPLSEVIRMGRETAEGLAAAHEKGLVHRDIKPANIWLEGKKLRVKVLDFGLARIVADSDATEGTEGPVTREGAVVGTPAYMSPEQGRGLPVDGRTDLFSLGVMLYQMTTGELPFRGATTLAILTSLALDNPPPPIARNPAVPQALSDCVMRLLAKDPAYRPPTAEIAAEELRAIEAGLVNAVRVIPLDSPPPLILAPVGPDPFAELDTTEENSEPEAELVEGVPADADEPTTPRRGFPMWALVGGVVLVVAGVVGVVVSQMGKKPPVVVQEEPPKPTPEPMEKPRAPGELFVLKYGDPAVEMRFHWVPPGTFKRGQPAREVTISKGFWMAETECTQAQWRALMKANPDPSEVKGDNLPVETISGDEAELFCKDLTKIVGKPIRLPSEAEWEYACRAGTATQYSAGDTLESLNRVAWCKAISGGKTHPVGELEANRWGLKDMQGNVWEWCLDGYDKDYYATSPAADPISAFKPPMHRVIRGGSWNSELVYFPVAYRHNIASDHRDGYVGFRVCIREGGVEPPAASGQSFFNGNNLDGWKGDGKDVWRVEKGELVGLSNDKTKFFNLYSDREYGDFEMTFDAKYMLVDPQMSAGATNLGFRQKQSTKDAAALELGGMGGRLHRIKGGTWGGVGLALPEAVVKAQKRDDYNSYSLKVVGQRITIFVNGHEAFNGDDSELPAKGIFVWQMSPKCAELRVKNIRFTDLSKPTDPTFFNGKDLKGWAGKPNHWRVENGAIVGTIPEGADRNRSFLASEKKYKDFEVSFSVRLKDGRGLSSLFFRSRPTSPQSFENLTGPRVSFGHNASDLWGAFATDGPKGPVRLAPAPKQDLGIRRNDFNQITVRCVGRSVRVTMNGQEVVNEEFDIPTGGVFGWEINGGGDFRGVEFRDIRFTDLSKPTDPDLAAAERLLPHVKYVRLRMKANGQVANIPLKEQLPSEPFWLIGVGFEGEDVPVGFAADILVPTVAGLDKFSEIHDPDCRLVRPGRDTDLAALGQLPRMGSLVLNRTSSDSAEGQAIAGTFPKWRITFSDRTLEPRPASGWKPLFNGKDLTGWKTMFAGTAEVTAVDGSPCVRLNAPINLYVPQGYANFHLRYEYKSGPSGALNIAAHTEYQLYCYVGSDSRLVVAGRNCRVRKADVRGGRIEPAGEPIELTQAGITLSDAKVGAGAWHRIEAVHQGDAMAFLLDGQFAGAVADVQLQNNKKERVPFNNIWVQFGASGGDPVHLRNIEIREVAALPQEFGSKQLFNGQDLAGWHVTGAADKVAVVTEAGRQALRIKPVASVVTKETFRNFHLSAEFLTPKPGTSAGVGYRTGAVRMLFSFDLEATGKLLASEKCTVRSGEIKDGRVVPRNPSEPANHVGHVPTPLNPPGEWNTLDIVAVGDTAVHVLNGKVVCVGADMRAHDAPVIEGAIRLYAIGGDGVVFSNIRIREITALPEAFGGPNAAPPDPAQKAARAAATWFLDKNAKVRINGNTLVTSRDALPADPFKLTAVEVTEGAKAATDDDLNQLVDCPDVVKFEFWNARITDRGVETLVGFPQATVRGPERLKFLVIESPAVTDVGVKLIGRCIGLKHLGLKGTKTTDTGLLALHGLTELEFIHLAGTKVSADGVRDLVTALPNCKIEWDGGIIKPTKKP